MNSTLSIDRQIALRLMVGRKSSGFKSIRDFTLTHKLIYTTYRNYELGKRSLTPDLLFKFSSLLGISPSWLLTGKGHPCQDTNDNIRKKRIMENLAELGMGENVNFAKYSLIADLDTLVDVDLSLLIIILEKVLSVLTKNLSTLSYKDIINFCLDTYNSVVNVSSDECTKKAMIELSVKSLSKGLKERSKLETA